MFNRVISFSILAGFLALVAGGPAMHYAPFLGFHSDHDHIRHAKDGSEPAALVSACACGQAHSSRGNSTSPTIATLSEQEQSSHDCDGSCSVCQFFSQLNLDQAELLPALDRHHHQNLASPAIQAIALEQVISYFERGPPIA